MSRTNDSKLDTHSGWTVMPLPPYSGQLWCSEFVHRWTIAFQATYSGLAPRLFLGPVWLLVAGAKTPSMGNPCLSRFRIV